MAKRSGIPFGFLVPFILVALAFAAYSVYWIYARGELEKGIHDWMEAERAKGATVDYESMELKGYPWRFALHLDEPVYSAGRFEWQGEELQLVMQPWNWNHVIGRAPGESRVDSAGRIFNAVLGDKSVASLSWTKQGLSRFSMSLDDAALTNARGDTWAAQDFEFHLRTPDDDPDAVQMALHWQALSLPRPVPDAEYLGTELKPSILIAEAKEAYPVIQAGGGVADWIQAGGRLDVPQLSLVWGDLDFGAKAELTPDAQGRLNGVINVRIENAEALIAASETSGALSDEELQQVRAAVTMLGAASQDGGFLPITLKDGDVTYLGQRVATVPPLLAGK